MPVAAKRTAVFTPEEYFDWEERQEERHEYAYGEVYTMPGGTSEHFLIIGNWVRLLGNALLEADALVYPDGMRVQIHDQRYVYPDVSVVVGAPEFRDPKRRVLTNPAVIVEVLSESTAAYDRGEKFGYFREVPSIQTIVWVDSERRFAEVAVKTDNAWSLPAPVLEGAVALPALGLEVALEDVYRGVPGLS